MTKDRYSFQFSSNIYWFLGQTRAGMKQIFENVYSVEEITPTFKRIYMEVFGDEYAEEADVCGFTTKTDLENIAKYLDLKSGELFADIACGRGGNGLTIARKLGVNLKGLDLSDKAIAIAKKRIDHFGMEGRAQYFSGDMRQLPYRNKEFDAAMCVDTLYFVTDKEVALQEVRRVLKPGKPFIILTWELDIPLAVNDYRPLLTEAGFDVEYYEEIPGWYERQKGIYEGFLKNKEALIQEMGIQTAAFWINGANTELPKLDKMRRVFIAARSR